MLGADQGLKKSKGNQVAKSKTTCTCGKCGEQGHSIRTCPEMKAVSAARLKEVLTFGKAKSSNKQPAAQLGIRATKAA
jgi:hypothetical protein